jgi:hypothetical protein
MKKLFLLPALLGTSAITLGILSSDAMARPMTETDLVMMKRLSAVAASPDGNMIAYQLR